MPEVREEESAPGVDRLRRRHMIVGWWSLFAFALLGMTLEAMHGFKVPWFLDPAFETRRLLWRLAHAHGTLLALIHLGFAVTLPLVWSRTDRGLPVASAALSLAGLLLPIGFLLGGLSIYGGDPGPGILLSPIGALCLIVAVGLTAWTATFGHAVSDETPDGSG